MNTVIQEYVEDLFGNAPRDRGTLELKEEFAHNLNAKFEDLVASGMSKEDAFRQVTRGVGNIQELLAEARLGRSAEHYSSQDDKQNLYKMRNAEKLKKKNREEIFGLLSGTYWMAVVVVYLVVSFFFGGTFSGWVWAYSWIIFVLAASGQCLGTAFFGYRNAAAARELMMNALTEEENDKYFKKWRKELDGARGCIYGAYWTLIVFVYFFVSFIFRAWAYSWVLFIIGAVFQNILIAFHKLSDNRYL